MIRLALKGPPRARLSLATLLPERLAGLPAAEIERLPLNAGRHAGTVGDWFRVDVSDQADDRVVISGEGERLDNIGAGMTRGELVVDGDAGAYVALGMSGGRLLVTGSAGYGAATALAGGEVRIGGDAGDQIGGALPGERTGMREGIVVVGGSAGASLGDRMRRGLIVVAGGAGPFCGSRMSAGTIVVGGRLGAHPGVAMRRGSIVALGGVLRLAPSFAESGVHELIAMLVVARVVAGLGLGDLAARATVLRRWIGDLGERGKGEILAPP
jgi:formylmethanofuran dehydrogenase subunit C